MDFNPLHTPRAASQSLADTTTQSDAGGYFDEYIDSDDEEGDYFEVDEDDDEVSSQMDASEHDLAPMTEPQGDESFQLAESIFDDESRHTDQVTSGSHSHSTSTSQTTLAPVADESMTDQAHHHTSKPHMTVVIKGVAYNTYRALLYYVGSCSNLHMSTIDILCSYTLIILSSHHFLHPSRHHALLCLHPLQPFHRLRVLKLFLLLPRREHTQILPRRGKSGSENG